jgi:TolB-like protein
MCSFLVVVAATAIGCSTSKPVVELGAPNPASAEALTLDAGLNRIAQDISASLTDPYIIAVTDFPDISGKVTLTSNYITEGLITPLASTGRFQLIERKLLEQVVKEQTLSLSGLINQDSAREIGKILGVDALISGTYADFGSICRINTRLISTETGAIISVAKVDVLKSSIGGQGIDMASGQARDSSIYTGTTTPTDQNKLVLTEDVLKNMDIVSGEWHIEQDRLSDGKIGNVLRQNELGSDRRLYFGNPELTDYTFELDVKVNKATSWPVLSFIVRNKEPGVYYEWAIGEGHQTLVNMVSTYRFYYQSGATRVNLHRISGQLPIGEWHAIKIKSQGNNITCYLDGNIIHQAVHDGSFMGRVGLVTHATDASFRAIKIKEL